MNKFTKLLSVFVIAGAVGTGAAALAGCGSTPEPHVHSGTLHEATAATCTENGYSQNYYTCDGTDCAGKYFSDEACTQEIDLATITIPATGHTEKYEDKGNGTHSITCEKGDLTEATEAHVDENGDSTCDKCNALFFAAGKYYNADSAIEIEIKVGGKVVYQETEYALSAITENAETKALSATFTADKEYTLTKTETGYELSWEFSMGGQTATIKRELAPVPATIAEDFEQMAGVYEGELTYGDYKVTRISITEDGHILFTQALTDSNPVTTVKDATSVVIKYNKFSTEGWSFEAKTAENNVVKTVELVYGSDTATFTRTAEAVEEIPEALPVDEFTYYTYTAATEEETSYTFIAKDSANYYRYTLNDMRVELISGDDTNGYLIKTLDSNYDPINYLLKVSADKSAVEIYAADKTTKLATLALQTVTYPTVKVDGTYNTEAVTDIFNSSYACYKIENAGWYTFTAGSAEVWIYTQVNNHQVTNYGDTALQIASGKSKTAYLEAGSLIAVDDYYKTDPFTATYSETEPVVVIEYASFTNGKYEIASFDGSETYYVKGTVETAGKYYVTVTSSERTEAGKECLVFDVNGVEYGSYYDTASWSFVVKDAGSVYSADLTAGTEVKVALSTPNSGWSFGKVTVYFETEEEYNARLESGGEEETDLFSADQIGTYVYADGNNLTFKVEANQITMSGGQYGYGTYNPKISKTGDTYTLSYMGYKLVFSFNADGNIAVTSDNIYDYNSFVAVKEGSSSGGGEEESGSFEGFTADQQGAYVYEFDYYGTACVITITLQGKIVYYNFNSGKVQPDTQLGFVSLTNGTYKFSVSGDAASFIEFTLGDGTVVVSNNQITLFAPSFTATKQTSGGETTGNTLSVGENTINVTNGESAYTFTATEAGEYTFTYGSAGDMSLITDGVAEAVASGSSLTLTAGQTIELAFYMADWSDEGTYTLTIAKAGSEEVSAKVGVNTVQAGKAGYAEITFSVPGTYTLSYDSNTDNVYYIEVNGVTVANGGKFTVTDSVTIKVYASNNSATSSFTIAVAEAGGGETTSTTLSVGANTINATFAGVEYTFTATEAGDYTITFDDDSFVMSNDESFSSGTTVTLTAGQSITLLCCSNVGQTATYTLTITKA